MNLFQSVDSCSCGGRLCFGTASLSAALTKTTPRLHRGVKKLIARRKAEKKKPLGQRGMSRAAAYRIRQFFQSPEPVQAHFVRKAFDGVEVGLKAGLLLRACPSCAGRSLSRFKHDSLPLTWAVLTDCPQCGQYFVSAVNMVLQCGQHE